MISFNFVLFFYHEGTLGLTGFDTGRSKSDHEPQTNSFRKNVHLETN